MLNSIIHGDCLAVMATMPSNTIDTIITDPPYGIRFRGNKWDYDIPSIHCFEEMYRVAKPGAFLLCFGGSRTFHRMTVHIEDAGWKIKDTMMWIYGSGMPKGLDIGKEMNQIFTPNLSNPKDPKQVLGQKWQGWRTALKPAFEPIIIAMKPIEHTYVFNALQHGVAGFNIDQSRLDTQSRSFHCQSKYANSVVFGKSMRPLYFDGSRGRYPSNVVMDENVSEIVEGQVKGASRFFYCMKATSEERIAGNNHHPTVKPLKLMVYLCTLTKTPFGGVVLDPFGGSGTTAVAAIEAKRPYILVEKELEYVRIARGRVEGCK
ncbi:MAG: site-specific DNA-methyltransferase [Candidatus Margulisbacteria bacterium]|nr:site-specific DNA-methyltransferase [Candidatus Margulisiibacteriota bacterium]